MVVDNLAVNIEDQAVYQKLEFTAWQGDSSDYVELSLTIINH
jgi:hypothetical protein